MNKKLIKEITNILESSEYSLEENIIQKHTIDWRKEYKGHSDIILFPKSSERFKSCMALDPPIPSYVLYFSPCEIDPVSGDPSKVVSEMTFRICTPLVMT